MSPRPPFAYFMVANRIRHSRKLRRHFKPDERWVYICTLAIASEAQPRGAFLTGGITPDAHDMADEAAVSVPVARRSLEKMREHGMLEQREDGAWHVHGFHEIQPKPRNDPSNADRQRRYRDRRNGDVTLRNGDDADGVTASNGPEVEGEVEGEITTNASSGLRVVDDPSTPDRPGIGGSV